MELNQTTLRGILAQVLSVDNRYIVPKQGNWYNPQEANANIENWCAYRIKSNRPRTAPYYQETEKNRTAQNTVCIEKIADIELQFIGPQSETLAQSVCLWPLRSDVKEKFAGVQGAVMYDDYSAVSSYFGQDGMNSITAWNVSFRVLWVQTLDTTQNKLTDVSISGQIK